MLRSGRHPVLDPSSPSVFRRAEIGRRAGALRTFSPPQTGGEARGRGSEAGGGVYHSNGPRRPGEALLMRPPLAGVIRSIRGCRRRWGRARVAIAARIGARLAVPCRPRATAAGPHRARPSGWGGEGRFGCLRWCWGAQKGAFLFIMLAYAGLGSCYDVCLSSPLLVLLLSILMSPSRSSNTCVDEQSSRARSPSERPPLAPAPAPV